MMAEPKPRHRFPKGNQCGSGRPRKVTSMEELIALATPAITEKVIEAAFAGDMTAAASIVLGMTGRKINR